MRKIYSSLFIALLAFGATAQTVVPKVPVYEIFSSSTCPPCKPANDHLSPIFEDFKDTIVVVKYQMSWPGTGDPYFTDEGQSRRQFYAVSGVPAVFRNSVNVAYSTISASTIESDLNLGTEMKMDLRYMIDEEAQSVRVRARIEALDDFSDGGHRIFIPITERLTTANKKTNGENEFHNVFKKMLPDVTGDILIGEVEAGTVIEYDTTYVFQGDYRLPPNATDPIDHTTEHSVEEFDDLHVVMFMQSLADKSIYQGAIGVREYTEANIDREWGAIRVYPQSIEEFNKNKGFTVFPNPSNDILNVVFANQVEVERLRVTNILGDVVMEQGGGADQLFQLSTSQLIDGVYTVEIFTESGVASKRFVVKH